jgi:hypothetical protein
MRVDAGERSVRAVLCGAVQCCAMSSCGDTDIASAAIVVLAVFMTRCRRMDADMMGLAQALARSLDPSVRLH